MVQKNLPKKFKNIRNKKMWKSLEQNLYIERRTEKAALVSKLEGDKFVQIWLPLSCVMLDTSHKLIIGVSEWLIKAKGLENYVLKSETN
jgi:hypothetical protein